MAPGIVRQHPRGLAYCGGQRTIHDPGDMAMGMLGTLDWLLIVIYFLAVFGVAGWAAWRQRQPCFRALSFVDAQRV